jgi:predicted acyl esterase
MRKGSRHKENRLMIAEKWSTSERKYGVIVERDVPIPMSDGVNIDCDVFRPADKGKFPAILGVQCYDKRSQTEPMFPRGMNWKNGGFEAGDPNFYVRRGYAQIVISVRGTGRSGGEYTNYGAREVKDTCEVIDWIANQPWCDGNVGMSGVSYYAVAQQQAAAFNPAHLKCIFALFGYTDFYRDKFYHGGILAHNFMRSWTGSIDNCRAGSWSKERMREEKYREAIARALEDKDIAAVPYLVEALRNPDRGGNSLLVDILINPFDGPYYHERNAHYENDIKVPSYLGGDWSMYGLHMNGAFRSWDNIRSAPKKLIMGPPIYLDRPVYQYQYESLRWFDQWLKGRETGIMDEPPVRVFVMGAEDWKSAETWPIPGTKWTPFYLHCNHLLSEHEFWPGDGVDMFEDNKATRGSVKYFSPPMVEYTEVVGPITLNLYASTTGDEVLWFVTLWDLAPSGEEKLLTRGWLRGSHRTVDPSRSKPWKPFHPHLTRAPLNPGEIYEFNIEVMPTANLFKPGRRIGLKISSVDDETPKNMLENVGVGHLWRQTPSMVTIWHDADHPSHLLLPVTRGNIIGTYMSGGNLTFD